MEFLLPLLVGLSHVSGFEETFGARDDIVDAFVAWVVYAAYLHARATAGWRGRGAAWINVAGFALNVFNLFFINLVTSGLHSYAGL